MILLKNGVVCINDQLISRDVLIDGNKIIKIAQSIEEKNVQTIDLKGGWIIPGGVDVHAHLREPGYEHKETVKTGTMSAVKGGITTIITMPNLKPVPDNLEKLKVQQDILDKDSLVRAYVSGAVTVDQKGEQLASVEELNSVVACFTDDGLCVNNLDVLAKAMDKCKKIIASHAQASCATSDEEAEYFAVERELELLRKHPSSYHFCHLSTKRSFELVEKAQGEGLDVTCEVMPHHLFLNKEQIIDANWKMNPPLRSEEDRLATIEALKKGVATMIATDHAPHSPQEKAGEYAKTPNGIIGFETMFPLVYTYLVRTGDITLSKMIELTSVEPAKRFGLTRGEIKEGGLCDIAVLDINTKRKYTKEEILSKSSNTPFIGFELYGFNVLTMVDGKVVYNNLK